MALLDRWEYLIGGLLKVLSGSVLASLLSLAATILVSRYLGASDFGMLAMLVAYGFICEQLFSCQTWQGVIKFGAAQERKVIVNIYLLAIGVDLLIAFFAAIAAVAGLFFAALWISVPDELMPYILIYLLTIALRWYGPSLGYLRLKGIYSAVSIQPVVVGLVRLGTACVAEPFQFELGDVILLWAAADVAGNIVLLGVAVYFVRSESRGFSVSEFVKFVSLDFLKKFLRFSLVANLHSSLKLAVKDLDVIVIGVVVGASESGVYKVAKQVPQALNMLISPVYQVVFPEFAKMSKINEFSEMSRMIIQSMKIMTFICVIVLALLCFVGDRILVFVFGVEYESGYSAMILFAIGIFIAAITITFQPAMLALDAASIALKRLAFSILIYVLTLFYLVNSVGVVGAAISFLVFYIVWALMIGQYVFRCLRGARYE